mmetsp:Transcript_118468/g.335010  ORF Transcript_118468/g.335010 Transcript_118468/m.335010 type:complete len:364 (+) Transcript_118468:83-1174(+)
MALLSGGRLPQPTPLPASEAQLRKELQLALYEQQESDAEVAELRERAVHLQQKLLDAEAKVAWYQHGCAQLRGAMLKLTEELTALHDGCALRRSTTVELPCEELNAQVVKRGRGPRNALVDRLVSLKAELALEEERLELDAGIASGARGLPHQPITAPRAADSRDTAPHANQGVSVTARKPLPATGEREPWHLASTEYSAEFYLLASARSRFDTQSVSSASSREGARKGGGRVAMPADEGGSNAALASIANVCLSGRSNASRVGCVGKLDSEAAAARAALAEEMRTVEEEQSECAAEIDQFMQLKQRSGDLSDALSTAYEARCLKLVGLTERTLGPLLRDICRLPALAQHDVESNLCAVGFGD